MKNNRLQTQGFAHYALALVIVVVAVIGLSFAVVVKRNHDASIKSNQTASYQNNTDSKNKLSTNTTPQSNLPVSSGASNTGPSPIATKPSNPAPNNTGTSQPSSSTPVSNPKTPQSPLAVLTTLIANLDNGSQINVTASPVTVPGPITDAKARPIVFTANGQTYFAYTQGKAPDFTASASTTANTMAVVNATVSNPPLVQAHLDKVGNLVDPNFSDTLVAYSQGGD